MKVFKIDKRFVFVLISFSLLVLITNFITQISVFSKQTEQVALTNAVEKTKERERVFKTFFANTENAVLAFRESEIFDSFFKAQDGLNSFKMAALNLAKSHQDIMTIRFIALSGMEKFRINRSAHNNKVYTIPTTDLQNDAKRDYLQNTMSLSNNKVTFSKLELNTKNGLIDNPPKPVIRAIMPVSYRGEFKGNIIITYDMQSFLDNFFAAPLYYMILADSSGELLLHSDKKLNWSEENDHFTLANSKFKHALDNETYLANSYFSRKLDLPTGNQLIIILSLNDKYLTLQRKMFIKSSGYSLVATLIIIALFAFILVRLLRNFYIEYDNRGKSIAELEALNEQVSDLLETNTLYMEMASDGIHVIGKKGNIVTCSQSFSEMLGYSMEEIKTLNVSDWDVNISASDFANAINSVTDKAGKFETIHKCKDGKMIDVEINVKWISVSGEWLIYASSRDITKRKRMEKELHKLATTDFLTQLSTRRIFNQKLSDELERVLRQKNYHSTVVLFDLDYFKKINDTYGHSTGDLVLKKISEICIKGLRKVDLLARLGGDEFGLILTDTSDEAALFYANRIINEFKASSLMYQGHAILFSASFGVYEISHDDSDIERIIERADDALYHSKNLGRNRVELYRNIEN